MQSNTHIILNMQAPNVAVVVNAKQGDKLSRVITADLVDGDIPFIPPSGVAAAVRYFKPDNTIGFYDVTEDGAAAIVLDGSTATVTLAEQALTVPGNVYAEINFYTSTEKLTTFNFIIHVQKSAVSDQAIESTDYFSVLTEKINAILGAAVNPPYINPDNKHWMLWSETAGAYVDSGYSSIGLVPPSTVTYQVGTSGTTPPAGTWTTTIPTVPQGAYLWTRTQFEFSDGTQQVSYSVARQGLDGTGSVRTVNENSPDENGNVYVMTVNPNLMDNWYFVGGGSQKGDGSFPINQRGQESYTGAGTGLYCLDRWTRSRIDLNLTADGINFAFNATGLTYGYLIQKINKTYLAGKTVTISCLIDDQLISATGVFPEKGGAYIRTPVYDNGGGTTYANLEWTYNIEVPQLSVVTTSQITMKLKAIKLELGDKQTLAHQDSSGNWVLNEIPNYAEQLARCQVYQQPFPVAILTSPVAFGYAYSTNTIRVNMPLPVKMRAIPSIEFLLGSIRDVGFIGEENVLVPEALTVYETENAAIGLAATWADAVAKQNVIYALKINGGTTKIMLNSNL